MNGTSRLAWRGAGLLLSLMTVAGCASVGALRPQPEKIETEIATVLEKAALRAPKIETLSGLAELTVRRGSDEHTVDAVLLAGKPDRLYMEFSGPLGISLGTVSIVGSTLRVINQRDESWWEGPVSSGRLSGLGFPTDSVSELIDLLLGRPLPDVDGPDSIVGSYRPIQALYRIEGNGPGGRRVWEIDPIDFDLVNYRKKLEEGWLIAEYSDETLEGTDGRWPLRISLLAPGAALDLEFYQAALGPSLAVGDYLAIVPESFARRDRIGDLFGP